MTRIARRYGLTLEQYQEMLEAAQGVCPICKQERKLVVDHDHKTGRVRGLLCQRCNLGIGLLGDDSQTLSNASDYLAESLKRLFPA